MDRRRDGRQAMQRGARAIYVPCERKAKESRIDLLFANELLFPAIIACVVDQCSNYPTHRLCIIEVSVEKMEKVTC